MLYLFILDSLQKCNIKIVEKYNFKKYIYISQHVFEWNMLHSQILKLNIQGVNFDYIVILYVI